MSRRVIDERIVSMQFDNQQFENNVKTSLGTLEKLKESLKFKGASKGLENINAAAKTCNLSPIGNAVDAVRLKFSALDVFAVTAFQRMSNAAITYGKKMISALTIDPIKTGFSEYETQLNSVQTILANTQSKGSTLEDVNAALDELNRYADQTIYNFTEMTRNIGTFTAAGVDLQTSVSSIKGIANLAAISGSTSQQASTAMYQLSQALAAGKVQLMDWNSVVNAGMGGEVFQEALKRTARNFGINVDAMIKKYGSFRESLTQGEWLTAEVLTETLTQLSGAYNKADLLAKGYTEAQADEILKLADTAAGAATDVKTFTQLVDTLKESAQSGWAQTWEIIVGDFEESKELWTGVSEAIGGFIEKISNSRNNLLEGALTSKWDQLVKKVNDAGIATADFEKSIKEVAKESGLDIESIIDKYGSLEEAFKRGAISSDVLAKALVKVRKNAVDLSNVKAGIDFGDSGEDVKKIQEALANLGYDIGKYGADGELGKFTEAAIKAFQAAEGLDVTGIIDEETLLALREATSVTSLFGSEITSLVRNIDELGGRDLLIESFANIFKTLGALIAPIGEAFGDIFDMTTPEELYGAIEGFHNLTEKLKAIEPLGKIVGGACKIIFAAVKVVLTPIKTLVGLIFDGLVAGLDAIGGPIESAVTSISAWASGVEKAVEESGIFKNILDGLSATVKFLGTVFTFAAGKVGKGITFLTTSFVALKDSFLGWLEEKGGFKGLLGIDDLDLTSWKGYKIISEFIKRVKALDGITVENIGQVLTDFKDTMVEFFKSIDVRSLFNTIGTFIRTAWQNLVSYFTSIRGNIDKFTGPLGEKFEWLKNTLGGFIDFVSEKFGGMMAIGALFGVLMLVKKIKDVTVDFVGIIGKPMKALTDVIKDFEGLGSTVKDSIQSVTKSFTFGKKAAAIKDMAIGIAILAGAIAVLAMLPWQNVLIATGAVIALAGALVGMAFLLSKFEPGDLNMVSKSLMSLSASLMLFALAARLMSGVDWSALAKCGVVIGGLLVALSVAGKLDASGTALSGFGSMIFKLSLGILMLGVVANILGRMDMKVLIQGMVSIGVFLLMIAGMMKATTLLAPKVPKFGTTMAALGFSLLILSGVALILGNMKMSTLIQGVISIGVFLAMIAGMMKATTLIAPQLPKFGTTMLGISVALLLMAGVVGIFGIMDPGIIRKGALIVAGFMALIVGMMAATKLLGSYSSNAAKIGLMMLSFAGGLLAMSVAIALLGIIPEENLKKSLTAIGVLMALFAGLMYISKFAAELKGVIAVVSAIGILAGVMVALTFLDDGEMARATAALSAIMGMFALLIASTKFANSKALLTVFVMTAIVTGIGFLFVELSKHVQNGDSAMKAAIGLSAVIASLGVCCALLGRIKVTGRNALAGIGLLAGVLSVLTIFTTIAIWQLPNIATQLSSFMDNLSGFLEGANKIKESSMRGLKSLSSTLLMLVGAAGIFAVVEMFTFGGMSRGFANFISFVTQVVPVINDVANDISKGNVDINKTRLDTIIGAISDLVEAAAKVPTAALGLLGGKFKGVTAGGLGASIPMLSQFTTWITGALPIVARLALDVSSKNVSINTGNLNAIIDAISKLAEAAGKVPTTDIVAGLGKFKGGWGLGGTFSWNNFSGFTSFVTGASTAMSGFASNIATISLEDSDIKAITSICKSVGLLAEAADKAPNVEIGAAFAKFAGGSGVGGYISLPNLIFFRRFVEGVSTAMDGFAMNIKASAITEAEASTIAGICKGVEYLGIAANNAPGIDVAVGFAKFAGGWGVGVGFSVGDLWAFRDWINQVAPIMSGFAINVQTSKITENDAETLSAICEAVGYLGEAAGKAPGIDVAAGLAGFAAGIAGGAYVSVPDLHAFRTWITEIVPEMSGFALNVKESKLTQADADALSTICEAVGYLGEAAGKAPGYDVGLGFASVGPLIAGGLYVSVPNLSAFKTWIEEVVPVMSGFALDVHDSKITEKDATALKSICEAVGYLGEAAGKAPTEDEAFALTLFGIGSYCSSTDLMAFKTWIEGVVPVMSDFAVDIANVGITTDHAATLSAVCEAATVLAEAAKLAPKKEEYEGVFGKWVTSTEFDSLKQWMTDVIEVVRSVAQKLAESDVSLDTVTLTTLANSAKILAETVALITDSYWNYGELDVTNFTTKIGSIADAMVEFYGKFEQVNTVALSAAASSARDIAYVFTVLRGIDYKKIDTSQLETKVTQIATAMKTFHKKLDGTSVASEIAEVQSLANLFSGLSSMDFSGSSSFEKALGNVSKTGVEKFIKAFKDGTTKAVNAAKAFVSSCISSIHSVTYYSRFWNVGMYLVQGFASGIKANTWMAEAKAKAMANAAEQAAKNALKVNSPSKVFIPLGKAIPEGLALGIERLTGLVKNSSIAMAETALDGTKSAISRISDYVNSDIDSQPTIRPVLDLSNITAGAGTISSLLNTSPSVGVMSHLGSISSMMNSNQNGANYDVISAIEDLGRKIGSVRGDSYNINGITYDDGSNVSEAVRTLVRAAKVERRI